MTLNGGIVLPRVFQKYPAAFLRCRWPTSRTSWTRVQEKPLFSEKFLIIKFVFSTIVVMRNTIFRAGTVTEDVALHTICCHGSDHRCVDIVISGLVDSVECCTLTNLVLPVTPKPGSREPIYYKHPIEWKSQHRWSCHPASSLRTFNRLPFRYLR